MTWVPLLLANPSPCLRLLVLRNLLTQEHNEEIKELEKIRENDQLVSGLLQLQAADGSWGKEAVTGNTPGETIQITARSLTRLGYLGFGLEHPAVQQGAQYLFRFQREDGSWPLCHYSSDGEGEGNYEVISLQTSLPLRGLAACGYATDPRVEKAYEWLLEQRLEDGAWPTGIAHGNYGGVAGYRRLAHSRWGCRSNTTGALACLALHPQLRHTPEAKQALDLLLACETRERHHLGFDVARIIGAEESRGFLTFYACFDIAQILDLCWRIGASREDTRVAELVNYVRELQGPYGLWEYQPKPQASRWVTYDILNSLTRIARESDWISLEPRTPFRPYPEKKKRY
ncbi:MAG: hypothetical protein GTO45_32545 [Candidatus Aminicenantes bacterium]|nr:hypothetical protein [Candidatus Aminicenantes bacterium]NIM83480.1 hypothetical protein [Candidatus Aminicenantes bacterium]NIN22872.1 hypothetical protein [Candidatus Aminicenantes bacterium]NIN46608.1 hypothetical protein [Candidatus Aminicenantes bacterium]NIN89511.1 hypothetical protein [Candidatus Aminicenantes bacterium]